MRILCIALVVFSLGCQALYLPGVAPKEYEHGEQVDLKVNKLTSSKTELAYNYYDLPFCQPAEIKKARENLGEILTGDVIENSPYDIKFMKSEECKLLCRKNYNFIQAKKLVDKIKEAYLVNWIVDNLPSAWRVPQDDVSDFYLTDDLEYYQGFPLGGTLIDADTKAEIEHFLNNHHRIIIKYHSFESGLLQNTVYDYDFEEGFDTEKITARIVGLDVEPMSVKHTYDGVWDDMKPPKLTSCANLRKQMSKDYIMGLDGFTAIESEAGDPSTRRKRMKKKMKENLEVIWTYDVEWERSDIKWATRWDVYLNSNGKAADEIHWFAIVNSLLIVVFLTGMVAMILMRTLYRDLSRYNRIPTEEEKAEDREETGWKLLHGDVFRQPKYPMIFSVAVGNGCQVLGMSFFVILFSAIGFISPATRGSLMLALLLLYVLMGIAAGYSSARTYKSFNGKEWQQCTIMTALLFPGLVFGILFTLNLIVWAEGSANAVPFFSMIAVLFLWFGISVPLTFLGAFYGFKQDVEAPPVKTHDIPRQVPVQPWFMSSTVTILMGGILPFGAVFVELFFIMSSLWLDQYYYVFGFLMLVFSILIITCAEITIVLCYFQLCGEDYEWQWRSFLTSGSCALYMYLYSAVYYSNNLQMDLWIPTFLYFCYMAIVSAFFFLATGVIGYVACDWFVRKIYGAVKVD